MTPITTIQNKLGRIYSDILTFTTTLNGSNQLLAGYKCFQMHANKTADGA